MGEMKTVIKDKNFIGRFGKEDLKNLKLTDIFNNDDEELEIKNIECNSDEVIEIKFNINILKKKITNGLKIGWIPKDVNYLN